MTVAHGEKNKQHRYFENWEVKNERIRNIKQYRNRK